MLGKLLVLFLVIVSGVFYYCLVEDNSSDLEVFVVRVIDGDTFDTDIGRVRLKGINAPEEKMFFYNESKEFLKEKIENKTLLLESFGYDKYGRILSYVFYDGENVNEEILRRGFGSLYYYEKDDYYNELRGAEEFARLNERGIWNKSGNSSCVDLVKLVYFEGGERCTNREKIILKNSCSFDIDVLIKDDATHIYREKILADSLFLRNFSCVWNDEGDTLYVIDDYGMILFYRY
ncbi:MAG: thermonuclease family protein [Candidatus Pacearchaeota archaeon]